MNEMMKNLSARDIAVITGGEVRGVLTGAPLAAVVTDSRQVSEGCLFAAIPGARVDGHDFIPSAAQKGAVCVLCERFAETEIPQIRAADVPAALRQTAAAYRSLFSDIPFIGITGSVGKTTAKEMTASVLSQHFSTLKTEKNFNNELGVPLTLFRLRGSHEAAVVEMGISQFGEMTRLTEMVRPDIAIFTLIGDAHLEFLGNREGVLKAKSEIVSGMPDTGVVIANGDDPLLRGHDFGRRTLLFGVSVSCDIRACEIEENGESGTDCTIRSHSREVRVHIPAVGRHLIYAALSAAAAGFELGLSDEEITRGIGAYETVGSRGRILHAGAVTILDDSYNANPTSMRAALDALASLPGHRVAVLGDMMELGAEAPELHRQTGRYAGSLGIDIIACGPLSRFYTQGSTGGWVWFEDRHELLEALPQLIKDGDTVLVKASHSTGLDAVVEQIRLLRTGADEK